FFPRQPRALPRPVPWVPLRLHAEPPPRRLLLDLLELLQQLLLLTREPLGHIDLHGDEQVPVPALSWHALPTDSERPSVLRSARHLERHLPVQRRDADVRTERSLRERDGKLQGQVVA